MTDEKKDEEGCISQDTVYDAFKTIPSISSGFEKLRHDSTLAQLVTAGFRISEEPLKPGVCPACGRESEKIGRRRLNTAYVDDERNWMTSCEACFEDTVSYYADLWTEYYNDCF